MQRAAYSGHFRPYDDLDGTIPILAKWMGSWNISIRRRVLANGELAEAYDRQATQWAETIEGFGFPEVYENLVEHALRRRETEGVSQPITALDCGTGTGAMAIAVGAACGPAVQLDALDASSQMLECAAEKLRSNGTEAMLRQGDVRDLPYIDDSFDMVTSAHVLEHLPNPDEAMMEMMRVLKPGGQLVLCMTRRSLMGLFISLKWRTHRFKPVEAAQWAYDLGFRNVEVVAFGRRCIRGQLSFGLICEKVAAPAANRVRVVR